MRLIPDIRGSRARRLLLVAACMAFAAGCNLRPGASVTSTPAPPTAETPTRTPSPVVQQVLLVVPPEADPGLAQQAESALQDLAAASGVEFVRQTALPEGDEDRLAFLLALAPDAGLQAWSQAHPQVPAAGLGIAGLQPSSSLSVIAGEGLRYDQLGFALGYLSAMVTPEYRVGALARDASPATLSLARGFVAGGTYYCGLCRPLHPPYIEYPARLDTLPSDPTSSAVSTLLVAPPASDPADLGITTASGIALVGVSPPDGDLPPLWMASVGFDVEGTLKQVWEALRAGQTGASFPLRIRYTAVDPARVSEGRLANAEAVLEDLTSGWIDTGIDPATGQLR